MTEKCLFGLADGTEWAERGGNFWVHQTSSGPSFRETVGGTNVRPARYQAIQQYTPRMLLTSAGKAKGNVYSRSLRDSCRVCIRTAPKPAKLVADTKIPRAVPG